MLQMIFCRFLNLADFYLLIINVLFFHWSKVMHFLPPRSPRWANIFSLKISQPKWAVQIQYLWETISFLFVLFITVVLHNLKWVGRLSSIINPTKIGQRISVETNLGCKIAGKRDWLTIGWLKSWQKRGVQTFPRHHFVFETSGLLVEQLCNSNIK